MAYFFLLWVQKSVGKTSKQTQTYSEKERLLWLWEPSRSSLSTSGIIGKGRAPGFRHSSLLSRFKALKNCLKAFCSLAKFTSACWEIYLMLIMSFRSQGLKVLSVHSLKILCLHLENPLLVTPLLMTWSSSPVQQASEKVVLQQGNSSCCTAELSIVIHVSQLLLLLAYLYTGVAVGLNTLSCTSLEGHGYLTYIYSLHQ